MNNNKLSQIKYYLRCALFSALFNADKTAIEDAIHQADNNFWCKNKPDKSATTILRKRIARMNNKPFNPCSAYDIAGHRNIDVIFLSHCELKKGLTS